MRILITAGGTSEPIDSVRRITNTGTGRLGSLVADAFAADDPASQIWYVCPQGACFPTTAQATILTVTDVASVERTVRKLLAEEQVDAIIHTMAVSDYRVRAVCPPEAVETGTDHLTDAVIKGDIRSEEGKISSRYSRLLVLLEQTPKILPLLRDLAPEAFLVGCKLLEHVPVDVLFSTATELLRENRLDAVLANDGAQIRGDTHIGWLVDALGFRCVGFTKQEIARRLVERVKEGRK
ncbi:MAG: phosphopantothenoylcysteine synthase [Sphaerochaeta sp.]|jgi:phosphopantothenate-cysteine ligase|nr:phosphopantothenoylcysteine synthase [Sphaerochaeta sp.]MCI2097240.1 phosphopantothenoylcysteine synthase [Sphaerochaeta sp.]MCI2104916.1 phosphopantothenoylcysteine synthase [Sphaerochaeta sp.]